MYFDNNTFGTDQIFFDNINIDQDSNSLDDINNIKNVEDRLLKKIKNMKPNDKKNCKPFLFSPAGAYIEANRMEHRANIEDYTYNNEYIRPNDAYVSNNGYVPITDPYIPKPIRKLDSNTNLLIESKNLLGGSSKKESFSMLNYINTTLNTSISPDLLIFFIFVLFYIVIVQQNNISMLKKMFQTPYISNRLLGGGTPESLVS